MTDREKFRKRGEFKKKRRKGMKKDSAKWKKRGYKRKEKERKQVILGVQQKQERGDVLFKMLQELSKVRLWTLRDDADVSHTWIGCEGCDRWWHLVSRIGSK